MPSTSCFACTASSLVALVALSAAFAAGCAHPQTVTLTSAAAVAAPAPVAVAPTPAPVVAEEAEAADADEEEAATPAPKAADGAMTFEQLSAALGAQDKMGLAMEHSTEAPAGKGLSADGYSSVGAAHQAVDTGASRSVAGDIKLSGGMSGPAVRAGVHEGAGRLRACYEHGLSENPRLAGRVMVSFSVDAHGAVTSVDTESDAIPADVTSCIRDAFSSMTFAPPKSAPAKIVYPIDFNKDS